MTKSRSRQGASITRVDIIRAVRTPLGFFTLAMLVVEAILLVAVQFSEGQDRTYLIAGFVALPILLVVVVGLIAFFRPQSLIVSEGLEEKKRLEQEIRKLERQLAEASREGPLRDKKFVDDRVAAVVGSLRAKHRERHSDVLPVPELLKELDPLFDRKTFRREKLMECTAQNWDERLHSAYQTKVVLEAYQPNVRDFQQQKEQYTLYQELLTSVDKYCTHMATNLFESQFQETDFRDRIGTSEFSSSLPDKKEFSEDEEAKIQPAWDKPRMQAVRAMDTLAESWVN